MAKTRTEILKERYSFQTTNRKYLLPGAEILKYVGQDVALLEFNKDEEGKWKTTEKRATLIRFYDFEPMTMTYMLDYKVDGSDEVENIRVQPEGASFENPEETGTAKQFIPVSLRFSMLEDGMFYAKVAELYQSEKTLSIEDLKTLSEAKEQAIQLRYSRNVGAAIRLDEDGTILYIRIQKLSLRHRAGDTYALKIENDDRSWSVLIKKDDETYDFEGLGRMKIIDLMDKCSCGHEGTCHKEENNE